MRLALPIAATLAVCALGLSCAPKLPQATRSVTATSFPSGDLRSALFELTPAVMDLGPLTWGQVVPLEFQLRNNSPATIRIATVSSSCGCMLASADHGKQHLLPGEVARLAFNLDLGVFAGPKSATICVTLESGEQVSAEDRALVVPTF